MSPDAADLVRAQGVAMALIATVLDREGVVARAEFRGLLALLATVTAETSIAQADILARWAELIGDIDT